MPEDKKQSFFIDIELVPKVELEHEISIFLKNAVFLTRTNIPTAYPNLTVSLVLYSAPMGLIIMIHNPIVFRLTFLFYDNRNKAKEQYAVISKMQYGELVSFLEALSNKRGGERYLFDTLK